MMGMTLPKVPDDKNRKRPERRDYNADEEYEDAIIRYMNSQSLLPPSTSRQYLTAPTAGGRPSKAELVCRIIFIPIMQFFLFCTIDLLGVRLVACVRIVPVRIVIDEFVKMNQGLIHLLQKQLIVVLAALTSC